VLATFGGTFGASTSTNPGPTAAANAGIAQYFATGLAARILADRGGAQLVSTAATSPDVAATVAAWNEALTSNIAKIKSYLDQPSGFQTNRDKLLPTNDSRYDGLRSINDEMAFLQALGEVPYKYVAADLAARANGG
jgi:hypothetical protein